MPRCYLLKKVKYPVERDRSPQRGPPSPSEATVAPSTQYHTNQHHHHLASGFGHDELVIPTSASLLVEPDGPCPLLGTLPGLGLGDPGEPETECAKQLLDLSQTKLRHVVVTVTDVPDRPSKDHSPSPSPTSTPLTSLTPSGCEDVAVDPPHPEEPGDPANSADKHVFNNGVTVGYTYDAFFITDGRSRKKASSGSTTSSSSSEASEASPAAPSSPSSMAPSEEADHDADPGDEEVGSPHPHHHHHHHHQHHPHHHHHHHHHNHRHHGGRARYTCTECGKHYATSSNLSRHKQTHRSLDSKLAKKCPTCGKAYVSMPALAMHVLTHTLSHKCDVCGKAFSRPWLLQGHMRSHTGEKPYGCAHCGKAFADRSNLRAHMQTHSAYKNFKCKRCDKSFALKSYLNKHYESACFKDGSASSACATDSDA